MHCNINQISYIIWAAHKTSDSEQKSDSVNI